MFAIIATFSIGTCSNVAQWEASVKFSLRMGSQRGKGAVVPCNQDKKTSFKSMYTFLMTDM